MTEAQPLGECVTWDCWKPAPYQYSDVIDPDYWYAVCVDCAAKARAEGCHVRTYKPRHEDERASS